MLEKMGFRADVAGNGVEAVSAVSNNPYDIVFMDCQMPEVDGYEATAQIRTLEGSGKHTTIVAMTAHALQGDKDQCLAAGMDDYIAKPVKQDDLAAAIDRWSLTREAINGLTSTQTPADQLLDESALQALTELADEDDPDLLEQLLSMFVNETPRRLEFIRQALRVRDAHAACEIAHMMKGTCAQLGLTAMQNLCRNLEERAESLSLTDCEGIVSKLEKVYVETKQLLETRFTIHQASS
jgi:CheY-like chemotaxis protein